MRYCVPLASFLTSLALLSPALGAASAKETPVFRKADLPSLVRFDDGTPVESAAAWPRRREEVRRLMCQVFIGTYPKTVPPLLQAEVLETTTPPDGSMRRRLRLTFGTPHKASFEMWTWQPKGQGPFPILLTAPRYYQIGWAEMALARGYLVCLYPGVDTYHHEETYPGYESVWKRFRAEYPEATWTDISTKAWLAGRALDYLLAPKSGLPVAEGQVGIIGWSRYGKQSLIAAAFDKRITAVVARSPGSPASCPYRFTSRNTFMETPADFPGEWFLSSLRSYEGREHELPRDAHGWYALIAPRHCLIHTAHNDGCEPTFAVERGYLEGREVYRLLGHPERLRVSYRPGGHGPITEEHRRENLDWFDLAFGRGSSKQEDFPEELIHHFDWPAWRAPLAKADLKVPQGRRERILWALGQPPEEVEWDGRRTFLTDAESKLMTHDRWAPGNTTRRPVSFGAGVRGNLYYNPNAQEPLPAVIWLHPYSYASGYNEGYGVQGTSVYHRLAQQGFAVLAYDQCGFGLRLLEGRDFYKNHPKWSRLGRMVHDVRAAVDFLVEGEGAADGPMPRIRKDRVFLLGYSLGGMVGLYAAALDDRVTRVASFCGFTPLRSNTDARPTGGIRRLWEWHALQPLLGLYHGREEEIPYDFDDVLALIAPRPCLVVSPKRDRYATFADVVECVHRAREAWKETDATEALTHFTPDDTNRFQAAQQETFLDWAKGIAR
jgi:dienelactone hydrolase